MDAKNPTQTQKKDTDPKSTTGTRPNPARFNDYQVLPDQTGFKIPGCDHVFEFDTHGGWFDEYNNYYNADGQPAPAPEYDDQDDLGDFDDIADALAKEYDMDYDDGEEEHLAHYDNIYLNIENKRVLENYLKDQEINAEIRNMNFNYTENDFEYFLKNKHIDYIEFEFEYDNRDRFRGVCYITLDKPSAQKLIEFNGSKLSGRDIKINILKPDEEDEGDAGAGGDITAVTSKKPEEQKTQWRAPVEKPKEESTATTTQATPTTGSELEKNQPQPSGTQQGQSQGQNQGRYQNQNQNYQKGQGYNQNQGQRQQNYQQNRGNQQGQYQKQGQSGIQRNYGGASQQQYQGQGQSYQQNAYPQQGQNYQNQRYQQGGYQGGQNQYQQYQNQGGYPQQQYYGAPQNQYQGQGGYQQYNYGGQGQHYGQQQQGYYQQAPTQGYQPSGFETVPGQSGGFSGQAQGGQADDQPGAWGKPLKKKDGK